jgi:cytochrome c-type biogenesis protein CcmH/NrfG
VGDAIAILEAAHRRRPADRDTLAALATYLGERGDLRRALGYAETLAALDPADVGARTLLESLRRRGATR